MTATRELGIVIGDAQNGNGRQRERERAYFHDIAETLGIGRLQPIRRRVV